jgi:tetratricopeptide (TPR) repeat protein
MLEKGTADEHALLLADIDADIRAVETLLAANKIDQAREHLDRAYEQTRLSVEQSREGETLLRELKFETPEDEFQYELDRNDTHRMLLTVLLQEKMKNERVKDRVHAYVEEADKLRESATDQASDERFEEAIKLLERSTAELVRAIRGAGVYIPG